MRQQKYVQVGRAHLTPGVVSQRAKSHQNQQLQARMVRPKVPLDQADGFRFSSSVGRDCPMGNGLASGPLHHVIGGITMLQGALLEIRMSNLEQPAKRGPRASGVSVRPQPDAFPTTQGTYLGRLLGAGEGDRNEAGRHIMAVYAQPLKVYLKGSSFRTLGEPDEIVEAFFADRLTRKAFLLDWLTSGQRLRYWLIRAFGNYLKEYVRSDKTWRRSPGRWPQGQETDRPEAAFHRQVALETVREALRLAEQSCRAAGQDEHWQVFIRHHLEGQAYAGIAQMLHLTPRRAGVMARTVASKFKAKLREVVAWQGAEPEEIDREIEALLETIAL